MKGLHQSMNRNNLKREAEVDIPGFFSRLYIACQTRDRNLEDFFRHENQVSPPSLSDDGKLHLSMKSMKSDLLTCWKSSALLKLRLLWHAV